MDLILRILILVSVGWMAIAIILVGIAGKIGSLGQPPISWPAMILAKIGASVSLFLMVRAAVADPPDLRFWTACLVLIFLSAGMSVFTPGLFSLGRSLRVGLPREQTALITGGIYRFSRNPIYLGIYWVLCASLSYAFSWLNLAFAVVAVFLHHRLVLAEKKFLAARFTEYEAYRTRVRRYL